MGGATAAKITKPMCNCGRETSKRWSEDDSRVQVYTKAPNFASNFPRVIAGNEMSDMDILALLNSSALVFFILFITFP